MEGLSIARKKNPAAMETLLLSYTTHATQPHSLVIPSTTSFNALNFKVAFLDYYEFGGLI